MNIFDKFRILIFSIFFSCIILSLSAYGEELTSGIVIADNVNLRENCTTNANVVDSLSIGENIQIVDSKDEWYHIKTETGKSGWVYNDLVLSLHQNLDPIKKGIITANILNIRKEPNINSKILSKLKKDTEVTIVDIKNNWYKIVINKTTNGWANSKYIKIIPNYSLGQVVGNNVNLRTIPSTSGSIITKLNKGTTLKITGYKQNWYKVTISGNKEGWIYKNYIKVLLNNNSNNTAISRSSNRITSKIIAFAKSNLGKPYIYGSSGPSSFDCSGFTSYIFKHFNIKIPRTSKEQAKIGVKVSKANLQPGDLVFFDTSGRNNGIITHVGIYIGSGKFIHASSGKRAKKVVISDLNEGFYKKKFVTARRVY
ncbi:Cell wall-associated hydrolase, NlpC family [Caminicella sporogenes DSM 14501]|uniref:Cell wall-associated hydrolase, NlpC family n=1 Tax=Caminicella sporogenes DSM 14501 TaxID=1121266 RepID=A0A1M6MIR2_9FIRM|nr:C40 family peptidase [Caminicella sporogenes]RKD27531.1 hypothetical protein BET04_00210 [Caminicella sporogenes]SHJ83401.1 Cell wall-associated hydrolase, NlpC family [Caminicella sporogenes DSM 14501]